MRNQLSKQSAIRTLPPTEDTSENLFNSKINSYI